MAKRTFYSASNRRFPTPSLPGYVRYAPRLRPLTPRLRPLTPRLRPLRIYVMADSELSAPLASVGSSR